MPVIPQIHAFGVSFGSYGGDRITQYAPSGDIVPLNTNIKNISETVEFNKFEEQVRDFILARLGFPNVRVELTDYQIKTCIDEAVNELSYHAPLATKQYGVFVTSANCGVYELPRYVIDGLQYVIYRRALLSAQAYAGSLEYDFFIALFTNWFGNVASFEVGNYFLFQQYMEVIRKALNFDGFAEVLDNKYLLLTPTPTEHEAVIVEFRAVNSSTISPFYKQWLQKYSLALAKKILGTTRGKFSTVPGPGGGATLDGQTLRDEAVQEIETLKEQLLNEIEDLPSIIMY